MFLKQVSLWGAVLFVALISSGCDRIYGLLHKPGGEERAILGEVVFNEYNPKVEEVQQTLKLLGYNIGRADGKFGAATREAVAKFQAEEKLEVTRFVDKETWARLRSYADGPFMSRGLVNARNVQLALQAAGYDPGKIDGQMGGKTREAVKAFQRDRGLSADGQVGLKTIKLLAGYHRE